MTAEEKFKQVFTPGFAGMPPHIPKYIYQAMIEFAQYHVLEALKAASKNVCMMDDPDSYTGNTGSEYPPDVIIDHSSILNAYPKENIK